MLKIFYHVKYKKDLYYADERISARCVSMPFIPFSHITIDMESENKEVLLMHELEHAKQYLYTLTLHPYLYRYSKKYRLWAETKAYKKQLEYVTDKEWYILLYAIYLSTLYNLNISAYEAYERLRA